MGAETAKFKVGDRVKVLPDAEAMFVGAEGVIDEVRLNERGIAVLDQYVVTFNWGEKRTFYHAHLAFAIKR